MVIAHTGVRDIPFSRFMRMVREIRPDVRLIALSPEGGGAIDGADFVVSSHDPEELIQLLREKFGAAESI